MSAFADKLYVAAMASVVAFAIGRGAGMLSERAAVERMKVWQDEYYADHAIDAGVLKLYRAANAKHWTVTLEEGCWGEVGLSLRQPDGVPEHTADRGPGCVGGFRANVDDANEWIEREPLASPVKPVAKRHAEKPAVQCDLTFKNGGPEKGFVQYDGIPGIEVGTDIPYVGVVKLCREGKWVVPEPTVSPAEKPANHSWINDRCQWRYDGKSDAPIMQCDPTVPLGTAQEPLLGETGLITYDQLPEDTKTYLRSHWPNSYPPCTGACGKHDEACEKRCRAAEHCPAVDSVSQ